MLECTSSTRPGVAVTRIAFYAPLKAPDHPVPSGDRTMARALAAALRHGGHDVEIASRFRSFDRGDPERQLRLKKLGGQVVERLLRRFSKSKPPELWFTYHLYHKAPDWLGPAVAARLGIPYFVAEASFAPKQAGGRWELGHWAAAEAIRRADRVFQLNPADAKCVLPLARSAERLVVLRPFLDLKPFRLAAAAAPKAQIRAELAAALGLDPGQPWLLTVAMMRNDQKLLSYRLLAAALRDLVDLPWRLIIVGAGPAEAVVRTAFEPLGSRIYWAGGLDRTALLRLYRGVDTFVWPAIKEAWGMALLEAQASGLPAVAGRSGGVPAVVADRETGLLAAEGDQAAFVAALRVVLGDAALRERMGVAASARAAAEHDMAVAAGILDRHIHAALGALAA